MMKDFMIKIIYVNYLNIYLYSYNIKNMNDFIVNLLFGLFYDDNVGEKYLNENYCNNLITYFQEFVKLKIMGNNYLVSSDDANICEYIYTKLNMDIFDIFGINNISNIIDINVKCNCNVKQILQENGDDINDDITFICINIGRNKATSVDIQKKVVVGNKSWFFYSLIYKCGDIYYTLICKDNEWFIFSIGNGLCSVKMNDKILVNIIKNCCCFVIYKC